MVQDDFYYYQIVAANIAHGHGSTFNGLVSTNGYHPLWLLVLSGLSVFTSNIFTLIWVVRGLAALATICTYLLSRRILAHFFHRPILSEVLAALIAVYGLDLYRSGMEILLAVPFALLLMERVLRYGLSWTSRQTFVIALIASLLVLSRLDSAILVLILGVLLFAQNAFRSNLTLRNYASGVLGFLPLAAYFIVNRLSFGAWMPVSGSAKQMRLTHMPSLETLLSVTWLDRKEDVLLLLVVAGLLLLPWSLRRWPPVERVVLGAAMLFPFVHFTALSILSDWPVWLWYYYGFEIALFAALVLLVGDHALFTKIPNLQTSAAALAGAFVLLSIAHLTVASLHRKPAVASDRVVAAEQIRDFANTHPGRYAMGDRAGVVAFLLPYPLIQTEGLTMDKPYLDHIRHKDDLVSVLRSYGVRYYVYNTDTQAFRFDHGCFLAVEPFRAGPTSPHMTSDICAAPVASYQAGKVSTRIFDLASERTPIAAAASRSTTE